MGEENKVFTDCFKSGFKDSIKANCGIVSILPAEFAEEYQACHLIRDYAREECFKDLSLSPKAVWVTQVSCFTPRHNVVVFDPPINEMKSHMKLSI